MGISIGLAPLVMHTISAHSRKDIFTLGRQDLDFSWSELEELAHQFGVSLQEPDDLTPEASLAPEQFFHSLGCGKGHSLDISNYENADFVHDLNASIDKLPAYLVGAYDCLGWRNIGACS